ncbi:MAG: hypothetical protein GKR93_18655 [Gammaproteobacteria bacterium]|nr:hypothetical protein [Gammaproteobacteria bacterium]
MSYESIRKRLGKEELILLDGGTGTEIERQGAKMNDVAWCGVAHVDKPDVVRRVHESYLAAGSDIIIANTFGTAPHVLSELNLLEQSEEINKVAVEIALQARDNSGKDACVAASMSSMPAFNVPQVPDERKYFAGYQRMAEILAEAGAELIVTEMMLDKKNASMVVEAANSVDLPVWIGFSASVNEKEKVMNFESGGNWDFDVMTFDDMATSVLPIGCSAAGIMHTRVDHINPALNELKQHWDGPLFAYAESGHFVAPSWKFEEVISIEDYLVYAKQWRAGGAQIIGGCCGIGPEHIRCLKENLQ